MTRTAWCVGLAIVLTASWPAPASAQTTVQYYHLDAVGSVRMITDQKGAVVVDHDYLPFGIEAPTPTVADRRAFAGNERDQETGLDYLGARYYASQTGRFTTQDPMTVDGLRIVNPQRWNRFVYAVNNPLKYVDPNGLDALLINYTDGSHGLGHVGVMSLNPNGSGLYGGFEPAQRGSPRGVGTVNNMWFPSGSVAFGSAGLSLASIADLRKWLAVIDGNDPEAIRIYYIKTSDAETAALEAYIRQGIASRGWYNFLTNNCLDFCVRGLRTAGIPVPSPRAIVGGQFPNIYFQSFPLDLAARLAEQVLVPKVETSYCIQGIDCK
jgi:RHS repeat-associated protein